LSSSVVTPWVPSSLSINGLLFIFLDLKKRLELMAVSNFHISSLLWLLNLLMWLDYPIFFYLNSRFEKLDTKYVVKEVIQNLYSHLLRLPWVSLWIGPLDLPELICSHFDVAWRQLVVRVFIHKLCK
jgi:hypothetical protein